MQPSSASVHRQTLTGHKFFLLFLFLLAVLVLYPYLQNEGFGYFAFRVVASAGLLVAVYAIRLRRTLLPVALLLAVPAVLERMLPSHTNAGVLTILTPFSALFLMYLSWSSCSGVSLPRTNPIRKQFSALFAFICW
jgi:hypothetical protein